MWLEKILVRIFVVLKLQWVRMKLSADTEAIKEFVLLSQKVRREIEERMILLNSTLSRLQLHWNDPTYLDYKEYFLNQGKTLNSAINNWKAIDLRLLAYLNQVDSVVYSSEKSTHSTASHNDTASHSSDILKDRSGAYTPTINESASSHIIYTPLVGEVFFCGSCQLQLPATSSERCLCGSLTISWYTHQETSQQAMDKWKRLNPGFKSSF